jgi:hypothetical protein
MKKDLAGTIVMLVLSVLYTINELFVSTKAFNFRVVDAAKQFLGITFFTRTLDISGLEFRVKAYLFLLVVINYLVVALGVLAIVRLASRREH